MVKLDIVSRSGTCHQSNSLADNKGHGLRLCLAYRLRGGSSPLCFVQQLVGCLMHQRRKLFRLRLSGQQRYASAVAHAEGWRDALGLKTSSMP